VQAVQVGVQVVQEVQAVQAKVQADFSITYTAQLYEYQHITIKECKMQAKWQKRCVGELLEHKTQALMGATRLASGKDAAVI
jgi:hypothetical protein